MAVRCVKSPEVAFGVIEIGGANAFEDEDDDEDDYEGSSLNRKPGVKTPGRILACLHDAPLLHRSLKT
jgi:hypothetical protein